MPSTTRATPPPRSSSTSASVRTPPPVWTGTSTAAASASTSGRLTGRPVRAASRSTTWSQGAPAAAKRRGQLDRVAVAGLAVEVALGQAHRAAVRGGRWPGRGPSGRRPAVAAGATGPRSWPGCAGPPRRTSRGGTGCPTPAPLGGGRHRAAVVAGGHGVGRQLRGEGVDEVHPRARPQPGQQARLDAGRRSRRFHCIWGCLTPAGRARTDPRQHARGPAADGILLGALVEELEAHADPEERDPPPDGVEGRRRRGPDVRSACRARPKAPTPGQHHRLGGRRPPPGRPPARASAPRCWRAFSAERRLPMP